MKLTPQHLQDLAQSDKDLATLQQALVIGSEKIQAIRDDLSGTIGSLLEPVPDVPPTVPAVPKDPEAPPEYSGTLYITEGMEPDYIRGVISEAPEYSRILVAGQISWMYLGSDQQGRGAFRADTTPLRNLSFKQDPGQPAAIMTLRFNDDMGGYANLDFEHIVFQPRTKHHKAAILCEQGSVGGHLGFSFCDFTSPFDSFDGFGMKWAAVMRGNTWSFSDCDFDPAKEHSVYDHNGQGDRYMTDCSNSTREFLVGGIPMDLGNGRTFMQVQERTEDGPESFGKVHLKRCTAHSTGHEGLLQGNEEATGGAAFTCGGNKGGMVIGDCAIIDPYCNSVALWTERYNKTGEPKGYRVPAVGPTIIRNLRTSTGSHSHRKDFIFGGTESLAVSEMYLDGKLVGQHDPSIKWDPRVHQGTPEIAEVNWINGGQA